MPMEWERHRKAGACVSVLLHPLAVGKEPLLWRDWSRREHRRSCMQVLRHQRVEVTLSEITRPPQEKLPVLLSRASRAHSRLWWAERLARNGRSKTSGQGTIRLFGVPEHVATSLG